MGEIIPITQKKAEHSELINFNFLAPDSSEGIDSFVEIINSEWSSIFDLNRDALMERFESGQVFIGAYINRRPAGILETLAFEIEEPKFSEDTTYKEKAAQICQEIVKMGNIYAVTNNGKWRPFPRYANVVLLVDITSDPSQRGVQGDVSVASGIVEYGKFFMRQKPDERPKQLSFAEYFPTFTPNILPIKRWHEKLGAFDTEVVSPNARPGYIKPKYSTSQDVNFMCYMAPGYLPELGQRQMQKSA